MATELCLLSVPDSLLGEFRSDPERLYEFAESTEPAPFGANHRNIEKFHFLLNGTEAFVGGPRGIFESWFRPEQFAPYRINDEAYGMPSTDVTQLLLAVSDLSDATLEQRWGEWRASHGIHGKDDDPSYFPESFAALKRLCSEAAAKQHALVWVAG